MAKTAYRIAAFLLATILGTVAGAQTSDRLELRHADNFEVVFSKLQDTTFVIGSVVFETESGMIYCDSAVWLKGNAIMLRGSVIIDDQEYRIVADSVYYDLLTAQARARGSHVELWSRSDSLYAVGRHAFVDRNRKYFYMLERPTLYLNYPDSTDLVEVIADNIEYDARTRRAEASGGVRINSKDIAATSGCAVMYPERHSFDLFEGPVVHRKKSQITGALIAVVTDGSTVQQVDVIDSAHAEFVEPTDSAETAFDRSELAGQRIIMDFSDGDLRRVTCRGQAYSWYYPWPRGSDETIENTVSGDTIRFAIEDERLVQVDVIGGAIGTYLSTTETLEDSVYVPVTDTIDYKAYHIVYSLPDSMISLSSGAQTLSGDIVLEAHLIELDTRKRVIEAFSGAVESDTAGTGNLFAGQLQPNEVPVVLKDKQETLFGDYLLYSIDTKKGRIVTSKSAYETGYFYGDNLYRQHENIFYLRDGRYTTCDADEPHFHFHSKHLKLIDDEKLIARPVVLSIGRLPILALPYYVFPLKKGRHSGFLPFTLGNIERGERYIRNVGYYWAASQYWDWQGALDYFENRNSLNIFSRMSYSKLYSFNGSLTGNYARETGYSRSSGQESRTTRWTLGGSHNHEFSPSFKVSATGHVQSDANYYNDFSTDLDQRLNRVVRSQVNFTKRFGKSVSVSGKVSHDDNLDLESRTDQLPAIGIGLPAFRPFGDGRLNDEGRLERKWYNELIATYRPSMINYSSRVTLDSIITLDTTISPVSQDTLSFRSRKKYTRVDHSLRISFPTKIARYITFNPSFSHAENWFKIYRTDQSDKAGIDASTVYRAYRYDAGASLSTKIYGTIYPNALGLVGLRQVITPTVAYRYTPEIDRHPAVSAYAGGGARSSRKSQSMSFSLNQVYQAKIRTGETERNLELVSVTSGFSYDLEREERKLSDMSTTFSSTLLPRINFYGDMLHSLYLPDSDELDIFRPRLLSFNLNAGLTLSGRQFLFDEADQGIPHGVDSASQLPLAPSRPTSGGQGWNLSASYGYSESGRGTDEIRKKSFLRFTLAFNLTPSTRVTYSQYYDVAEKKTINNQVSINRQIHCWTGTFHWVPTGSNRGWGFRLFVTAIPAVRIDNSQNTLSSSYFQTFR